MTSGEAIHSAQCGKREDKRREMRTGSCNACRVQACERCDDVSYSNFTVDGEGIAYGRW